MPRLIASVVTSAIPDGPELPVPVPPFDVLVTLRQEPGRLFRLPAEADEIEREAIFAAVASGRPLYIAVDGDLVTDVTSATVGRVTRIGDAVDGYVHVSLDSSARGLRVAAGAPELGVLSATAGRVVMLKVGELGEIIDAREAPEAEAFAPVFGDFGLQPREEINLPELTVEQANQAFNLLRSGGCDVESRRTCIPFDFPDEGCEARAHEMCRRLSAAGIDAGKVWVFPPMRVYTRNWKRGCYIDWDFHVAPFLSTTDGDHVLDPALFTVAMPIDDYIVGLNAKPAKVGYSKSVVYQVTQGTGRGSRARRDDVSEALRSCRQSAFRRNPQPPYCPPL